MCAVSLSVKAKDAILRAVGDLTQVLKGQPVVKGETRTAIDLLLHIFKTISNTNKSPTDIHQEEMAKAAVNRADPEYDEEESI